MFAKHFQNSGPGCVGHDLDLGTLIVVGTCVVNSGYSDRCYTICCHAVWYSCRQDALIHVHVVV